MKKFLLLLFAGFNATIVFAQPILTASGTNPVIGDIVSTYEGSYVAPGNAGANQTWDLSSMTGTPAGTYTAVAVSSTPMGSSFPGSNICLVSDTTYTYYNTTPSLFQFSGLATGTLLLSYSDPEDYLRFPCTYNSSYTDTWAVSFTTSITFYRKGSSTVTADGYGTLKTPAGTYNNAMRIHTVQTYKDSADISGFPYIITYSNDEYMWYVDGTHYPVATLFSLSVNSGPPEQGATYIGLPLGINDPEVLNKFEIFPNPVSSDLRFDIDLKENKTIEVQLFNAIGTLVRTPINKEGKTGPNEYTIHVGDLTEGIYFARIILDGVLTSTRKFTVLQ